MPLYIAWRALQKGTLNQAAVSADAKGDLHDELKTAFWFVNNPRPSDWVDAQMRRAARNAQGLKLEHLFPRQIPKAGYAALAMAGLFVVLNFVPLPWNHNWLALQAAPAFALNEKEAALLKQTEELLRKAEKLKQSDIAQKLEDIVQQLEQGKIDAQQAAQMLDNIQSQLEEGNLDSASINEGLEEMAKDLQQSDKLDPAAARDAEQATERCRERTTQTGRKAGIEHTGIVQGNAEEPCSRPPRTPARDLKNSRRC